jgi:hypothetical protein
LAFNTSTLVAQAVSATSLISGTWTFTVSSTGSVTLNGTPFVSGGVGASGTGTTTTFVISNITQSTGTNSGALQVAGGAGIGGNLNVGGIITATNIYVGPYAVSTASALTIRYGGTNLGSAAVLNFSTGTTATLINSIVTVSTTPGQFKPNVYNTTSIATATIDVSVTDQYNITVSASTTFITTSSVTVPNDGQRLMIRIRGDGTARNITWTQNATGQFRIIGISPPTITSSNKLAYVACIYNAPDGYWDIVSYLQQP